ncbi:MAG TPA: nucleoside recognition protein [Methanosarcinales archaeon]|nr:nucleoside recognition protein [Methanosarcinales archaeon]
MMTSFPAIVMHWRALLPVLIPLLGITGLIYFGVLMLIGLLKTSLIMLAGRLLLDKKDGAVADYQKERRPPVKEAFKIGLQTSEKTIKRILRMTIPTTFLMFILLTAGAFDTLASHLQGVGSYFPVPSAGFGIIAAQFASYLAAHATAGALLSEGTLNSKEVILTLLVGDVLSSISMIWRWMIPYYVGIFGPAIGMQILAVATTIRTLVTLVVIFVIALF